MKANLYNQNGEKKGEVSLPASMFNIEVNEGLVPQYLIYQQANARASIAHAKTRAEVRGGGRKPFKQKGTGRARQGSTRNVHMKGGGVAFGTRNTENYSIMMPKAMRRKALFSILSSKAKDGKIMALDKFELETPKTKTFDEMLSKINVERNVLLVANKEESMLRKSARNHSKAKVILSSYLNPADLLTFDGLMFTEAALKDLETTYVK